MAAFHFYDIETLDNVFTNAIYKEDENAIDVFILSDDPKLLAGWDPLTQSPDDPFLQQLAARVYRANDNFRGTIRVFDLSRVEHTTYMAEQIGVSTAGATGGPYVNHPRANDAFHGAFRPVCDTDEEYDPDKHPYLCGYNSYSYDTTMLARYFDEAFKVITRQEDGATVYDQATFEGTTAKIMREHSDNMFRPEFKNQMESYLLYSTTQLERAINPQTGAIDMSLCQRDWHTNVNCIRKNMLMSGRHIDIARLNEKQRMVGLKRLCGMEGHQILESDKLGQNVCHIETQDELFDLIAYNVSDVVNLAELFKNPFYQGAFSLKQGLLSSYPDLVYDRANNRSYTPVKDSSHVRRDRLIIDSTSAQFATKALCPYDHLTDIDAVSFLYPCKEKAEALGIAQRDILDECKEFFYSNFPQPEVRAEFDRIYNYYDSIRGKNFNPSEQNYAGPHPVTELTEIPNVPNCVPYFNADGTPSSCYVTFSTGGIHGMEYNKELFEADCAEYERIDALFKEVKQMFPDPLDCRLAAEFELSDGKVHKWNEFLLSGSTKKKASYKAYEKKKPELFVTMPKGNTALNKKYAYTSADFANHEDFTSYYPNLLIMMGAFVNTGLGYDRYEEIFGNKERFGKLMKDKSLPEEERAVYKVQREGTKLVLNSASGAADATFDSPIRMNNRIISMRIIGQLFSWRIGQAQTIKGAKIISTNTDGLYSVMEQEENDRILAEEASTIGVAIEPEPMFLISKDSNNRLELGAEDGAILAANGAALSCWRGPTPTQSLAHAAIIDWALAHYMVKRFGPAGKGSFGEEFDYELGREILEGAKREFDDAKLLQMFQTMVVSRPGTYAFVFSTSKGTLDNPTPLQHYNRAFFVKEDTEDAVNLHEAAAKKVTDAQRNKRLVDQAPPYIIDPTAREILEYNGAGNMVFGHDRDTVIKKITGIDEDWACLIDNRSIYTMPDEDRRTLIDALDIDKYLTLLGDAYTENWRNATVKAKPAESEAA